MVAVQSTTKRAQAALLAASNALVSRTVPRGSAPVHGLQPRYQVPGPADVAGLLDSDGGDAGLEHRMARVTAGALLYAGDREPRPHTRRILRGAGGDAFDRLEEARGRERKLRSAQAHAGDDASCLYCRLFSRALYGDAVPDVVPVNHGGHVRASFDAETNVSKAEAIRYQILTRERDARTAIDAFHPLLWHEYAPGTFARSDPAREPPQGRPWEAPDPITREERERTVADWRRQSGADHFSYEEVTTPLNERVTSDIRNILSIRNFKDCSSEKKRALSFRFGLEACLQSDFGNGPQYGGLDVDGGYYDGEAVPLREVLSARPKQVEHLTERDLAHLPDLARLDDEARPVMQAHTRLSREGADRRKIHDALERVGKHLEAAWGSEPWIVTVSTSKRLRYTAGPETPPALWSLFTWLAPAELFAFINRAVCQPALFQAPRS